MRQENKNVNSIPRVSLSYSLTFNLELVMFGSWEFLMWNHSIFVSIFVLEDFFHQFVMFRQHVFNFIGFLTFNSHHLFLQIFAHLLKNKTFLLRWVKWHLQHLFGLQHNTTDKQWTRNEKKHKRWPYINFYLFAA